MWTRVVQFKSNFFKSIQDLEAALFGKRYRYEFHFNINRMHWLNYIFLTIFLSSISSATRHRRHHIHQHQLSSTSNTPIISSSISNSENEAESFNNYWYSSPELSIVRRVYADCQDTNDFIGCLKKKALIALSRALEKDSIKIVDGLVLEKQNQTERDSFISAIADARTLNSLTNLDRALLGKIDKLVRTHALKMDMSTGREKKKKKEKGGGHMKYIVAALVTAMGIAGPLGLKALAAIAIKALVISKIALTIAGIIALKKLFAHEHHEETSFQVHAGDHNRRSTYVIRPVPKASAVPALTTNSGTVDPYRYYYEYHQ